MQQIALRFSLCGLFSVLTLGLSSTARAQYAYDITPLGGYRPFALNNLGQVVGAFYSTQYQQYHAFEYSNGQTTDLFPGKLSGDIAASGINDQGQIAGTSGVTGPFRYDSRTRVSTSLGIAQYNLGSGIYGSYASAINQNGDIAGQYTVGFSGGATHAYLYSGSPGQFKDITSGYGYSAAYAINNSGQTAGSIGIGSQGHAFLSNNGIIQDIGTLSGGTDAEAGGINDSGTVVGYSDVAGDNNMHAFVYQNGTMQRLPELYTGFSDAFGINNAGDIVGENDNAGFIYHNGAMTLLSSLIDPSLGWNISNATAINDRGQIIGTGNFGGFIMTPHIAATPAPGSLLTLSVGVGVMLFAVRQKRTAASR